jgi:hypothetical protein
MRKGRVGERANEQAHSLSLANACNPYYEHTPLARDNTSRVFPLVFHLAPTHPGWNAQRKIYSSVQGPPGVETPTDCIVLLYEARYGEAISSEHGPDYDWRTSPIDPQAVYASGGKAHERCGLYIYCFIG